MLYTWFAVSVLLLLGSSASVVLGASLNCTGADCSDRTCEPLISSSLAINCVSPRGRGISCGQRLAPGTKANLVCKEGYERLDDPGYNRVTCEDDGTWDKCPFSCQRICGYANPSNNGTDLGRFPWYATIFRTIRKGRPPNIACGGTIISDNVILTAAHCVFDNNQNAKVEASKVHVAVGTGVTKWNDENAQFAQFYNVKQIIIHPKFQGIALYFRDDIAAIIVSERIKFDDYISPACIDYQFNGQITEPTKGTQYALAGYKNIDSGILQDIHLPSLPLQECIQKSSEDFVSFLTDQKLCGGDPEENEFVGLKEFGGSGALLRQDTADGPVMFMRAILSVGSNFQGIVALTDVLIYRDWIKEIKNNAVDIEKPQFCGRTITSNSKNEQNKCQVPPLVENGLYAIGGLATPPPPGSYVSEWSVIKYSCQNSYGLTGDDTGICANGQFPTPPSCLRKCKALTSNSVQFDCVYKGKSVPCDEPVVPDTVAYLKCKRGYKLPYTPDFNSITCGEDGTWPFSPYRCIADCGLARPKGISLVVNGQEAGFQDFPWHVGIYLKQGGKHKIWCGGSIITNKMVVTAAHCFYVPGSHTPMDKSQFAIAAGKIYSDWNAQSDTDAQFSELKNLIIPETYDDIHGSYSQDIALIELQTILDFSAIVRPICMDWDFVGAEEEFVAGTRGVVSGWGLVTEGGETSPHLKYAILPTVPRQVCLESSPPDFRPFITADKFCAGYLNGTSVCKGDSGGGLAIPVYNGDVPVYYLRGVVSVGPTKEDSCDSHRYTAFTRVLSHINWLRKYRK